MVVAYRRAGSHRQRYGELTGSWLLTSYGSWYWPKDRDRYDAPAVAALRNAGCIIICKTTAPEFGWKGTTSSRRFGITRSAIDLTRTSGGSSGGAASSVAVGMADLALGTDAGGSVRIPPLFRDWLASSQRLDSSSRRLLPDCPSQG